MVLGKNTLYQDRASIVSSMPSKKKPKRTNKRQTSRSSVKSFKVVNGKVLIKLPGYPGTQKIASSNIIRQLNNKSIKLAAKKAAKLNFGHLPKPKKRTKKKQLKV